MSKVDQLIARLDDGEKAIDAIDETIEILKKYKRSEILLKAAYDILAKQLESAYVLNLLEETAEYDEATCDGSCLLTILLTS